MPDELRRFVRANFRSLLQLELLLLLARSPDRWWTADEVSRELRCAVAATPVQLDQLVTSGLLEKQQSEVVRFRYAAQDAANDAHVRELLVLHEHRFHAVVDLIYTNRAREFANAFKLRKGDDDDG